MQDLETVLQNGSFQAYDNWWVYLKDAQSKGF